MMKYCLVYPFFRCVCVRERRNDTTRSKKYRIKRRKENTEDFTRKIEKKKKEGERADDALGEKSNFTEVEKGISDQSFCPVKFKIPSQMPLR